MIPSALLCDLVSIEPYEGPAAHGALYGSASVVAGRLEPRRTVLRAGDGTEVIARAVLIVRPNVTIGPEDRISCDGRSYRVLNIATRKTGRRSFYLEVMLG